jgi:hypothetical protein
VAFDLQIDEPAFVPGIPRGGGDKLQPQRLEAQEDACVEQGTRVDEQDAHEHPL